MAARSAIYNCWNCGGPGINHTASNYICPSCEVIWRPHDYPPTPLSDVVPYSGFVVTTIDFSKPGAPSSPG
jgi:hypothetical protein